MENAKCEQSLVCLIFFIDQLCKRLTSTSHIVRPYGFLDKAREMPISRYPLHLPQHLFFSGLENVSPFFSRLSSIEHLP